mmetsp:Transcript_12797/g.20912  ORF Transcript_12797/g.20912 Transcript_12797/m.20912 type:complete len:450 (-) Transcript_12797:85-1434(-)|eukprot:CAMPEP_0184672642 /NCGR_PEP_ID=MMETSP0308-20130426/86225_1 /TAXON_ID=38269 /ORGANISM="Gloeochaete witrockiana, Strain SAG 46.84" /LENGTH=449 /DNA_ID=CAMNT_0027120013 /DNA_START=109 /DNA_END=1458 /DNA_ORIENTATION=-
MTDIPNSVLFDKCIVVVGSGFVSKKFIFDKATELGVRIVLVDLPGSWASDLVEYFIPVDTVDHENAAEFAVRAILSLHIHVDGVVTFWEDDVPLCAQIASRLRKIGNSYESTLICRSKYLTRNAMERVGLPVPKYHVIRNSSDLEDATSKVPFPSVLKPAHGAEAEGATKCATVEDVRRAYKKWNSILTADHNTIYTQGNDFILEQYLDGHEVDVDLLLQNGRVVFSSVMDNLPTNEPDFVNTGSILPSVLSPEKQRELVSLAARTSVEAVGLRWGAVHVEMKYTTNGGPHIVEVNGRMCGGSYCKWIRAVWNFDFVEASFRACCGLDASELSCPTFGPSAIPLTNLCGVFILSDHKDGVITFEDMERFLAMGSDKRVFDAYWDVDGPYEVDGSKPGREELGGLTTCGASSANAIQNLLEVLNPQLGIIPHFLFAKRTIGLSDKSITAV